MPGTKVVDISDLDFIEEAEEKDLPDAQEQKVTITHTFTPSPAPLAESAPAQPLVATPTLTVEPAPGSASISAPVLFSGQFSSASVTFRSLPSLTNPAGVRKAVRLSIQATVMESVKNSEEVTIESDAPCAQSF